MDRSGVTKVERAEFLDIVIHPMTIDEFMGLLTEGIRADKKLLVAHHNLHSVYLFHKTPQLKHYFQKATYTLADGMSLVALACLYGYKLFRNQRVCYMDWWPHMMRMAVDHAWRVFYLGSAPGIAERGEEILRQQFPGLELRVRHGFFDPAADSLENKEILRAIAEYKPNLLVVGMGMPRQELWIESNYPAISANIILPAGATLDYIAGAIPTPPRWAGRFGVAWLFRLAAEPSRLATRYLVEPWSVLALLLRDLIGLREARAPNESRPEERAESPDDVKPSLT